MSVEVARQLLANMPDEVFNLYIAPLIPSYGWPFQKLESPAEGHWLLAFDHRSLKELSQLSWERLDMPFSLTVFDPSSQDRITAIGDQHIRGMSTPFAHIENARERFFRARDYIARTGRMPVPVVLMWDWDGLRILDGNHRLAAMASFSNASACTVDCWIGRPF